MSNVRNISSAWAEPRLCHSTICGKVLFRSFVILILIIILPIVETDCGDVHAKNRFLW
ncbi:hypothetical protein GYMLUDRAFT_794602 [Collybiopsis luxurians FD-317 M1]|nr:hypothetical protein GYMLUDRAFT_794602 [Collybiopsis luxurians FD-317 M1]